MATCGSPQARLERHQPAHPNVNLVVGVVTVAGRLSLAIEYVENNIENETMDRIEKAALGYLFEEN